MYISLVSWTCGDPRYFRFRPCHVNYPCNIFFILFLQKDACAWINIARSMLLLLSLPSAWQMPFAIFHSMLYTYMYVHEVYLYMFSKRCQHRENAHISSSFFKSTSAILVAKFFKNIKCIMSQMANLQIFSLFSFLSRRHYFKTKTVILSQSVIDEKFLAR